MTDLQSQPSTPQTDQAMLDLEAVLNLPQGRRFLMTILGRCGVYGSAYTGDASATDFKLGQQNVGLWLINELEQISPTTYPQLLLDQARLEKTETVRVLDAE